MQVLSKTKSLEEYQEKFLSLKTIHIHIIKNQHSEFHQILSINVASVHKTAKRVEKLYKSKPSLFVGEEYP